MFLNVISKKRAQTHEKLSAVNLIHREACERLQHLQQPFAGLHDLTGRRQTIMQALNHGPTREYLNVFGFRSILTSLASLLNISDKVVHSQGRELQTNMQNLLETITDDINHYIDVKTFVVQEYLIPFLKNIQSTALALQSTMADRFDCTISVPASPHELEKKYPST